MTGEVVSLRRARKRKARSEAEAAAAASRAVSGVSRAGRAEGAALLSITERRLDGHRLQAPPTDAAPADDA